MGSDTDRNMSDDRDSAGERNAYDAFPYTNYSYAQTHIARLYLLGRLFGLDPPDFRRAKILELGCGAGGNILPMADEYPASQFLGIDLSVRQIQEGRDLAAAIGVANIELTAQSVLAFDPLGRSFDYIICHGMFSWVAPEIQTKIMAVIRAHLSPRGLAFVSYNTLPGWGGPARLREMMVDHSSSQSDPIARIAEARRLLEAIGEAQGDRGGYYRTMVEAELALVRSQNERYVFHEYLEDVNQPIYFRDFAALAEAHGLTYVTDADPGMGYVGNYEPKIRPFLSAIGDRLRREQYLDYMQNRRFRSSLLAHASVSVSAPEAKRLEPFWLAWEARPDPPEAVAAQRLTLPLTFVCANGLRLSLREPVGAALAIALHDTHGKPRRPGEIAREAKSRFGLAESEPELTLRLCKFLLPTFLSRGVGVFADPGRQVIAISERPIALPVARAKARRTERVTNALHEVVVLDAATRAILPYLDGTAERATLAAILDAAQSSGRPGPTPAAAEASASVARALDQLARNALLIG